MKIAIIGWGSLIWNPADLKMTGPWHHDGPLLPIEFARISQNGRLTLVLHEGAPLVQTLWAKASCSNLNEAIKSLREREGTNAQRIGYVSLASGNSRCRVVEEIEGAIAGWAKKNALDAVIWTDLPSNFCERTQMKFDYENALVYLRSLRGDALERAKEYFINAPPQVRTPLRAVIEKELRWQATNI